MFRKLMVGGMLGVAGAVSVVAVAPAEPTPSLHYRGTLSHGGHIAITRVGSTLTAVSIAGKWDCQNITVPVSTTYNFTAHNRPGTFAHVNASGVFRFTTHQMLFSSRQAVENTGAYYSESFVVSGTIRADRVNGSIAGYGEDNYETCPNQLHFTGLPGSHSYRDETDRS